MALYYDLTQNALWAFLIGIRDEHLIAQHLQSGNSIFTIRDTKLNMNLKKRDKGDDGIRESVRRFGLYVR